MHKLITSVCVIAIAVAVWWIRDPERIAEYERERLWSVVRLDGEVVYTMGPWPTSSRYDDEVLQMCRDGMSEVVGNHISAVTREEIDERYENMTFTCEWAVDRPSLSVSDF